MSAFVMRLVAWLGSGRRLVAVSALGLVVVSLAGMLVILRGNETEPLDSFAACAEAGFAVLDGDRPTCRAGGHTYLGPESSTAPVAASATGYDVDLLVSGDLKNDRKRQQVVIRDQIAWSTWWARLHEDMRTKPPLLPVDFTNSNVVIIIGGPQETDGYVYKVTGVSKDVRATVVDTLESVPTIGCAVENHRSNRYSIVRTPRLDDPVVFRNSEERRQCDGQAR